jgi:hypothetical protein
MRSSVIWGREGKEQDMTKISEMGLDEKPEEEDLDLDEDLEVWKNMILELKDELVKRGDVIAELEEQVTRLMILLLNGKR